MTFAKSLLLPFWTLVVLLPASRPVAAQEPVVLPVLLRLEGVGTVYGIAGGVRKVSGERGTVLGGAVTGDVQGQGAAVTDLELWGPRARLALFLGRIEEAHLTTSYTRGTAADRPVEQTLAGYGAFGLVTLTSAGETTAFRLGAGLSTVELGGYHDGAGNPIPLPDANLHDINTVHLLADGEWRKVDDQARPRSGVVLGFGLSSQTGRAGQSDVLQTGLRATGYVPLGAHVTWGVHARGDDAYLLRRAEAYDTPEEVAAELGADCGQVDQAERRAACEGLAEDLARYIAAGNRYGTVTPLGGSTSLRAYREGRFRAAHTRLFSTELRVRLSQNMETAMLWERGQAADERRDLGREPRDATGLELRYWFRAIPVRLGAANGSEGRAWFFTAGMAW